MQVAMWSSYQADNDDAIISDRISVRKMLQASQVKNNCVVIIGEANSDYVGNSLPC